MKENEIKINDHVYVVRKFGNIGSGFDVQIIRYKVQYKGLTKFIPYGFQDMSDKYREIEYGSVICKEKFIDEHFIKEEK